MIPPFLLLSYMHLCTYMEGQVPIYLPPTQAPNILLPCRYIMPSASLPFLCHLSCFTQCQKFLCTKDRPSSDGLIADRLIWTRTQKARKCAVGDIQDSPYIYFTENILQGCLKTTSDNNLLLGSQGQLGSGSGPFAAAHSADGPDSSAHLSHLALWML